MTLVVPSTLISPTSLPQVYLMALEELGTPVRPSTLAGRDAIGTNKVDDSPLYVFDSRFGDRGDGKSLLNDYRLP